MPERQQLLALACLGYAMPIVAHGLVLRPAYRLEIDGAVLRWRSLLGRDACPLTEVEDVALGGYRRPATLQVIGLAGGRKLYVGEGAESDRLMRELLARVDDFHVRHGEGLI